MTHGLSPRIAALLLAAVAGAAGAAELELEPLASAEPPAATSIFERCLAALVEDDPAEGAWCDVRIDELNRALTRSEAADLELAAAYHNRAALALRRGDLDAARADLDAALALAPANAASQLMRGNLELRAGNFQAALEALNEAVTLIDETQLAPALHNRALALRGLGDIAGALRDAEAAERLRGARARGPTAPDPQTGS